MNAETIKIINTLLSKPMNDGVIAALEAVLNSVGKTTESNEEASICIGLGNVSGLKTERVIFTTHTEQNLDKNDIWVIYLIKHAERGRKVLHCSVFSSVKDKRAITNSMYEFLIKKLLSKKRMLWGAKCS